MHRTHAFRLLLTLLLCVLCLPLPLSAQDGEMETDSLVLRKLEWFRDQKFGFMMHWGPYSQWGIVESWSICPEDVDWAPRRFPTYDEHVRQYELLPRTFNPVRFDPASWATAAADAGMRYLVFTTKHHDGFCMFDTRQTDYRITDPSCPFAADPRADITRQLFDAFRAKGFGIGAYFSKPDWHSPYYWAPQWGRGDRNVNYVIARHPDLWRKFCEHTFNQIEELMTGYGAVDILWLDGGWVRPMRDADFEAFKPENGLRVALQNQDIDMPRIAAMARRHQPGLLVVDRTVTGRYENYRTPEQQVPDTPPAYPWETCMTMANQWSYLPGDEYKPARKLIHLLVDIVAKGGNFLLNVGPTPEGTLPDTALARMREIGRWIRVNGGAIHATRPVAPYKDGRVCFTTAADGTVFAIVLADTDQGRPPAEVAFTAPFAGVRGARMLGSDTVLPAMVRDGRCVIRIPEALRMHPPCEHAWALELQR